jgi:dihydrofolate reductase
VDGGITIQRFLQDGLIQRLVITRVPVLIGTGIPHFGAVPRDIVLRHVGTRQYASGLVQSEYEVVDYQRFERAPLNARDGSPTRAAVPRAMLTAAPDDRKD